MIKNFDISLQPETMNGGKLPRLGYFGFFSFRILKIFKQRKVDFEHLKLDD